MGAILWGTMLMLGPLLERSYWRSLALVGLIGVGIVSYGIAGQTVGAFRLSEFRTAFRRKG
jgi:putative peptidoglycan lipid II flippase